MKIKIRHPVLIPIYAVVLCLLLLSAYVANNLASVFAENEIMNNRKCVVIDAGHGGVDGGATSCTGVLESRFNLEIAIKLCDLMHLLGIKTVMIRNADVSVYTEGSTIAAKKLSDLKQRVKITNETDHAILVSIHQNHFSDSRYKGAQVFYAPTNSSEKIAKLLQTSLCNAVDPENNRQIKPAEGVYLMQNINCPGVLVECGFLSNPEEEAQLRSTSYQNMLCAVITSTLSQYLHGNSVA